MLKKLLFSFLIATYIFSFVLPKPVHAQSTWYNPSFLDWYQKVYDTSVSPTTEIFGERYAAAQVTWVIYGLFAFIMNLTGSQDVFTCLLRNNGVLLTCGPVLVVYITNTFIALVHKLFGLNTMQNHSLAATANQIFSMQPMSGIGYFLNIGKRLHIVPEAYAQAQGFGFNVGASAAQELWVVSRNITYSLMIIVIIALAFMIMFKVKLSPQTAVTVQSAIPRIIIALILITFSYAIAGFMIDLMYIIMAFVATILNSGNVTLYDASKGGTLGLFQDLAVNQSALLLALNYWVLFIPASFIATMSILSQAGIIGAGVGFVLGIFIALLVIVLGIIAALIAGIKILWLLLKTYVNLLILIFLGPFEILLGVITPAIGFGSWLKEIIAQLVVYPVVAFMYVFAFLFLVNGFQSIIGAVGINIQGLGFPFNVNANLFSSGTNQWAPPMTTGTAPVGVIWIFTSLTIMMMIPKAADIIKGLLTGRPLNYGAALGEGLGFVGAAGMGAVGAASAKQQSVLAQRMRDIDAGKALALTRWEKAQSSAWNFVRGASRGNIK